MSVHRPPRASGPPGVAAGIKANGNPDLALVVNDGPPRAAAGVFTSNRVKAAPVLWSAAGPARAAGSAPSSSTPAAPTPAPGPHGFQDTHATAEKVAEALGDSAGEIAVCSTGLIGERLPMDKLLPGVDARPPPAVPRTAARPPPTPSRPPTPCQDLRQQGGDGCTVGGMAKGAGMLAPGLATMLCVLTTDADVAAADARRGAARRPPATTFDRVDSDGCMSTNDTVLLLATGASGVAPDRGGVRRRRSPRSAPTSARQLLADAEGATKDIAIEVVGAATRGRRRRGRPLHRPQQPAQVRHPRRGPQLGPGAVRDRHHRRRLRARPAQRRHQRRLGLPRTAPSARTGPRSTCAAAT